ncbi:MAG TPA: hypothetical protein VF777_06310 [Phycisphaerales bacterium]
MPSGWLRRIVVFCVIACVAIEGRARGGVPPVRPIGMVLELQGELDHAAQFHDIRKGVEHAKADGVQIVAIEIRGRAWRYDLSRALGEFVAASELPIAVFVTDGSLGVALAGAPARGGCWARQDLTLLRDDESSEYLASPKSLRDDAKGWVKADGWSVLREHDALRAAIVDPRKECWLIESRPGSVTTSDDKADATTEPPASRVVPISDPGNARLRVGIDDAVALGLLAGRARNASEALRLAADRLGLARLDVRGPREIGQRLVDRRDRVALLVDAADGELDRAEKALEIDPGKTVSGPGVKHLAGAAALSHLLGAKLKIDQVETALTECPEILRVPVPNTAAIGLSPGTSATRWRSRFEGLRKRADTLEKRATEFCDAK